MQTLRLFSIILFITALTTVAYCRTECMKVIGKLMCPSNPKFAENVRIDLIDSDPLPFEIDDQMGRTWTSKNGEFLVSGCGSDFGPFNPPDPYIIIQHECPSVRFPHKTSAKRRMEFALTNTFLPHILRIGKVFLDDSDA